MKNAQLTGDLGALEIGLLREDFGWVLTEAERLKKEHPEAQKDPVLNYFIGQALFRREMKGAVHYSSLIKANEHLDAALKADPAFADAHALKGYATLALSIHPKTKDRIALKFSAAYHFQKAKELKPECAIVVDDKIALARHELNQIVDVSLCSIKEDMVLEWMIAFEDFPWVNIIKGDITKQTADAVVSPANSFGFMDGGLDYHLTNMFGESLQARLQEIIRKKHHGELIVGQAEILETGCPQISYLISAPTMRVPMPIRDTMNPYLATRAALLAVNEFNREEQRIKTVVFPGMGTGMGEVPYAVAARQMKAAYEAVVLGRMHFPKDFAEAQHRHRGLAMEHFHKLYKGKY